MSTVSVHIVVLIVIFVIVIVVIRTIRVLSRIVRILVAIVSLKSISIVGIVIAVFRVVFLVTVVRSLVSKVPIVVSLVTIRIIVASKRVVPMSVLEVVPVSTIVVIATAIVLKSGVVVIIVLVVHIVTWQVYAALPEVLLDLRFQRSFFACLSTARISRLRHVLQSFTQVVFRAKHNGEENATNNENSEMHHIAATGTFCNECFVLVRFIGKIAVIIVFALTLFFVEQQTVTIKVRIICLSGFEKEVSRSLEKNGTRSAHQFSYYI